MNVKDIKDLLITINNTDIEIVEIEKDDIKIKVIKGKSGKEDFVIKEIPIQEDTTKSMEDPIIEDNSYIVKSPMVGVFYEASSPEAEPFVKVGDRIEKGNTLCIIEAMKIMNEIECEESGEVMEIFVKNEEVVEYGQALMKIRR